MGRTRLYWPTAMIDVLDEERQELDPKLKEIVDREPMERRDLLLCANCNHGIARQADRIEVSGSFSHFFTNPYGIEYHVGCYADALGCAIAGERMAADTWFPGFRWRLASCEPVTITSAGTSTTRTATSTGWCSTT